MAPANGNSVGSKTGRAAFPDDPDEFDQDSRISSSDVATTYILTDENGQKWEWLKRVNKWTEATDQNLIEQQAEIYKMPSSDSNRGSVSAKKRKESELEEPAHNPKNGSKPEKPQAKNSAVFVTALPDDVTIDEICGVFRRFGMIHESVETGEPRVKLYYDDEGRFKGEALVVYFRAESVALAVQMQDGADFRLGEHRPIRVSAADEAFKAHKEDGEGKADRRMKAKPKAKAGKDREVVKKKMSEMNSRLADWSDDDEPAAVAATSKRWDKVVVVKNAFTLATLDEDPDFLADLEEDMREGAEAYGPVKKVTIFDKETAGVVTIRFEDPQAARACVRGFDGRGYNGRALVATIADGTERFQKSRAPDADDPDNDAQVQARLAAYAQSLEASNRDSTAESHQAGT